MSVDAISLAAKALDGMQMRSAALARTGLAVGALC